MPEITSEALGNRVSGSQDSPLVLDTRHRTEFEGLHIPESRDIDIYDELEERTEAGIEDTDVEAHAATLYGSLQRLRQRHGDSLVLPARDSSSPEPPVTAGLSGVETQNDDLGRDRESLIEGLASDIPDHPPNFQRVKRVNAGDESVGDDELSSLELGPNRCVAA